jgi:hypothetical protein
MKIQDTNKTRHNSERPIIKRPRYSHDDTSFENKMYSMGLFMDVPRDWHAGASEREETFRRSLGAWVNGHKHDAGNRAIAERLSKHVRYVTDSEFRSAFSDSVQWAIHEIRKNTSQEHKKEEKNTNVPIHIMAITGKSSAWLGKIAWDIMNKSQKTKQENNNNNNINKRIELAGFISVHDDPQYTTLPAVITKENKEYVLQHVLYCDDASYSGTQLHTVLQSVVRSWETTNKLAGTKYQHFENNPKNKKNIPALDRTHVYVVVPFMSMTAINRMLDMTLDSEFRNLARTRSPGALSEIIDKTGIKITYSSLDHKNGNKSQLTIHINPVAPQNVMGKASTLLYDAGVKLSISDLMESSGATLTTFNHKTPDDLSFYAPLLRGQLITASQFSPDVKKRRVFLNLGRRAYSPKS